MSRKQTTLSENEIGSLPSRSFIESSKFPVAEISEASRVEKGPGRPPHWEMVFWWTRKPLISARAVIAGCLLPEDYNPKNFLYNVGIKGKYKSAHRNPPLIRFDGISLLDPFAGFGSIPLEGARLGLKCTAVELLPTAYVFLKAVLEYPAKYGKKLVDDIKKWGEWITERLKEDPIIRELYDNDVAVYIGSWEIKCPHCGRWTPLVGNWWLARVKGKNGYERLAWMKPEITGDKVKIKVVDLNKMLGDIAVKKASVSGNTVKAGGKEFRVPQSNIDARREQAICLLCGQPIMQIDPETGKHYTEKKGLPKEVKDRLEGYIKFALKLYNKNEDLPKWIIEVPARQRLLVKVKVKERNLEFESCTERDQAKLELVRKEVEKMLKLNDPDIPMEVIPNYEARSIWVLGYGFDKWYKLFNPRQLLTLIKLVKLIRKAGKKIVEEKLKEGLNQEEAFKYAEAVTTYLAIALCKYINYNTLTTWVHASNPWGVDISPTLATRGIAMQWNWCEINPFIEKGLSGILKTPISWIKAFSSEVNGLKYLVSAVRGTFGLHDEGQKYRTYEVLCDDATVLAKLNSDELFDLIVTDPPYYDDVPYSELSDFYYVWLKRALSDVEDGRLKPRFILEAFFEKIGNERIEVMTQWEKYALSEVSLNPPRLGANAKKEDGIAHFQNLLNSAFITMSSRLKTNGMLVTYYAHTSPDAWKSLLKAGWESAGFRVTNAFPIATESAQSVVSRGKLSMDTSIVVVWRKIASNEVVEASKLYDEMVEVAAERARELIEAGWIGRDLVIGTLAAALSVATKYKEVRVMGRVDTDTLVEKYVYPAAYLGLARAYARKAELRDGIRSSEAMFYLLVKATLPGAKSKVLESTDVRIFSIGTSMDVREAIEERIILPGREGGGARVAKAKTMVLVEPTSASRSAVAELLALRGLSIEKPEIRCSVDMLHLLEYHALAHSRREFAQIAGELRRQHPAFYEEAISMAKIFSRILPDDDPERELCRRILEGTTRLGG